MLLAAVLCWLPSRALLSSLLLSCCTQCYCEALRTQTRWGALEVLFIIIIIIIVWGLIRKRAHMQLVRRNSVTVVSTRWATVVWSWSWSIVRELIPTKKKKKKKCRRGNVCSNILPKSSQARKKPPHHHLKIQEELEHPVRNLGKAFREWQAGKADSELALSEQTNKQANKQTNKPGRLQNVIVFTDGPVLLKASFGGASL